MSRRFSPSEIRAAVNDMDELVAIRNEDPTNFAARAAAAAKENAAFHKAHPSGWATTPKRTLDEMKAIRYEEIRRGRTLSEPERDAYLRSLCDASK